jgi:hypothetical protein
MVLSQPGILSAEMPGQQGAESAWQLPVPKSCQQDIKSAAKQKSCQPAFLLLQNLLKNSVFIDSY